MKPPQSPPCAAKRREPSTSVMSAANASAISATPKRGWPGANEKP
jgi:hypothetical protein